MTDIPLDSIGSLLGGRDHSTIIHGIKKIADEYDSNEQTRNLIETIKKKSIQTKVINFFSSY